MLEGLGVGRDISLGVEQIERTAAGFRNALAGVCTLTTKDSEQLASAFLSGRTLVTADKQLMKSAMDLGVDANFVGELKAVRNVIKHTPSKAK